MLPHHLSNPNVLIPEVEPSLIPVSPPVKPYTLLPTRPISLQEYSGIGARSRSRNSPTARSRTRSNPRSASRRASRQRLSRPHVPVFRSWADDVDDVLEDLPDAESTPPYSESDGAKVVYTEPMALDSDEEWDSVYEPRGRSEAPKKVREFRSTAVCWIRCLLRSLSAGPECCSAPPVAAITVRWIML